MDYTTNTEKAAVVLMAIMLVLIVLTALTGCQTVQTPEGRLDRDKVIRIVDNAEMVTDVCLTFAELRGADPERITKLKTKLGIAYDLVRDSLAVRLIDTKPEDLGAALLRLRLAVNKALLLCDSVGVSAPVMAEVRTQIDGAFVVMEAIVNGLEV